jgi:hypothetical protein
MDLQVGGTTRFNIAKSGAITITGTTAWGLATGTGTGANQAFFAITGGAGQDNYWNFAVNGTASLRIRQTTAAFAGSVSGTEFVASNGNFIFASNNDLLLTRRGAANLRLGAADAAAPVAQTLSVQSVVAGTTNTAGTNLTITGSQGTGTGAGGSLIFQVAPAGSSGSAQNALVNALTISGDRSVTFGLSGFRFSSGTNQLLIFDNAASDAFGIGQWNVGVTVTSSGSYRFSSNTSPNGTPDVLLARDAANTLALRNGTAAQTFNVYNTTDGTNSEFLQFRFNANVAEIRPRVAGTGTNRELLVGYFNGAGFQFGASNATCSGNLIFSADNTHDIGASGANRPRYIRAASALVSPSTTVASLPAAGTAGAGARSLVTDANATTFQSIVAAGGANVVPVYSDGTNWRIG